MLRRDAEERCGRGSWDKVKGHCESPFLFPVVSRGMPSGAWFRSALALVPTVAPNSFLGQKHRGRGQVTVYSRLSSGRAGWLMPTVIWSLGQRRTLRRTHM